MTLNETAKLLAMISAYYGEGKSNPKTMVKAWHICLKDCDYEIAEQAVIQFAKHDAREYAVFPSVGQMLQAIKTEQMLPRLIHNLARQGALYSDLSERARELISEDDFYRIGKMDYEDATQVITRPALTGGEL